jgi:hypothetical protein
MPRLGKPVAENRLVLAKRASKGQREIQGDRQCQIQPLLDPSDWPELASWASGKGLPSDGSSDIEVVFDGTHRSRPRPWPRIRAMIARAEGILGHTVTVEVRSVGAVRRPRQELERAAEPIFEAKATVFVVSPCHQRNRRLHHVANGHSLEEASINAAFFALRRLLIGDVPVLGRLIDRDDLRVTLTRAAGNSEKFMLEVQWGPRRRHMVGNLLRSTSFMAQVTMEPRDPRRRTRYLRVHVTSILKVQRQNLEPYIDLTRKAYLHRLLPALAHVDVRGLQVHHVNGYGPDCGIENLEPMTKSQHQDLHLVFAEGDDGSGHVAGLERFDQVEGELLTLCSDVQGKPRHRRQEGLSSWYAAIHRHRAGTGPFPPPMMPDRGILSRLSDRADRQRHLLALLDFVWDSDEPVTFRACELALSLSLSAVRQLVESLCSNGLIRTVKVGRRLVLEALFWPTPLYEPQGPHPGCSPKRHQ